MSKSELAEKLAKQRRKTEVESGGLLFESKPEASAADIQGTNAGSQKASAPDGSPTSAKVAPKQDFAEVMQRQRAKTAEGESWQSNPVAHVSDSPTSGAGHASQKSQPPKGAAKKAAAKKAAAPEEKQAETPAAAAQSAPPAEVTKAAEAPASESEVADMAADLMDRVLAGGGSAKQGGGESDSSGDESDDMDMPQLQGAAASGRGESKQNRAEKKSRKAVSKLGFKPVQGIVRVTMMKAPRVLFVIERPEVFQAPGSATYVVFGESRIEDLSAQAQASAAERVTAGLPDTSAGDASKKLAPEATEIEDDGEEVDESGMEPKDIELVIAQASVSRARAVRALRANNSDIVEAIMALSSE